MTWYSAVSSIARSAGFDPTTRRATEKMAVYASAASPIWTIAAASRSNPNRGKTAAKYHDANGGRKNGS